MLLRDFGVDLERLQQGRRPLVRYCLDWTEQRHHLAGALGAAVCDRMFTLGWLLRGTVHRSVRLTGDGRDGLATTFGIRQERAPDP